MATKIGLGSVIRVSITRKLGKRPTRRVVEGVVVEMRPTTLTNIDTGAEYPATDFRVFNEKAGSYEWTGALRDPQARG